MRVVCFSVPKDAAMPWITPNLGNEIRRLRKQRGMSQLELAQKLGFTSAGTVSQYENGYNDPDEEALKRINELFGVNLALDPSARSTKRAEAPNVQQGRSAGGGGIRLSITAYADPITAEAEPPVQLEVVVTPQIFLRIIALANGGKATEA